jgi:hypothetical protein
MLWFAIVIDGQISYVNSFDQPPKTVDEFSELPDIIRRKLKLQEFEYSIEQVQVTLKIMETP